MFLKWVYKHVDKAFYVGTHNKAYFIKHGLKENNLIYAPHAIDNERFVDFTGDFKRQAKVIRKRLGISDEIRLLIFVGKFEPNKNLIELINAINNSEFNLLLVGNGPQEKVLKEISSNNIHFMPFQNQTMMPIIYRIGDALILNSISETWGLAINESLASGIPVIASDKCGGAVDLINENNGMIIKCNEFNEQQIINMIEFTKEQKQHNLLQGHNYKCIISAVLNSAELIKNNCQKVKIN
jgi:glycosyltransferase involved in cell wall biosynthesis